MRTAQLPAPPGVAGKGVEGRRARETTTQALKTKLVLQFRGSGGWGECGRGARSLRIAARNAHLYPNPPPAMIFPPPREWCDFAQPLNGGKWGKERPSVFKTRCKDASSPQLKGPQEGQGRQTAPLPLLCKQGGLEGRGRKLERRPTTRVIPHDLYFFPVFLLSLSLSLPLPPAGGAIVGDKQLAQHLHCHILEQGLLHCKK
eukprot:Hpha_TRINITY_DN16665_c0_g2::TRINITY_DN16665_c0_g2_i1::g.182164::m.182164